MRPGLPEKAAHDYVRRDTDTHCSRRWKSRKPPPRPTPQEVAPRRQLVHAQAPEGDRLVKEEPVGHPKLHPDLGILAQPCQGFPRHHHPTGNLMRHLILIQDPHYHEHTLH